jgi:hypothetical protein
LLTTTCAALQLLEAQHPKVASFDDPVKLNIGGVKYALSRARSLRCTHATWLAHAAS